MKLTGYNTEYFKGRCVLGSEYMHGFAYLNETIGEVLPYLNTVLGGSTFIKELPSLTLKTSGKLITLHDEYIAMNAIRYQSDAEKIFQWLQNEINQAWENRDSITPDYSSVDKPVITEILKALPKTNCKACKEATCMVFAVRVMDGVKDQDDCPEMSDENRKALKEYLSQFRLGE